MRKQEAERGKKAKGKDKRAREQVGKRVRGWEGKG